MIIRSLLFFACLQVWAISALASLEQDKIELIEAIVTTTYVPSMEQLLEQHDTFTEQLKTSCQPDALEQAAQLKQAWLDTYLQWKQVESFVFGPVTYANLQRKLGFWPTREVFIQRLIQSERPMEVESLPMLSIASKGYPALEWVIYTQLSADITPLERQRYCDLSRLLVEEIHTIINQAITDYAAEPFQEVIRGERELTWDESFYSLQPFAEWLSTVVGAQYAIRKLHLIKPAGLRPGTRAHTTTVDAYLSGHSRAAMLAGWQAMKSLYLGNGQDSASLLNLVEQYGDTVAGKLRAAIDAVDEQLDALPEGNLTTLAENHKPVLENLAIALTEVEMVLQMEVTEVLQTQSFFVDQDGD